MAPIRKSLCRAELHCRVVCCKFNPQEIKKKKDKQRLGPGYSQTQSMKILDRVRM